MMNKQEIANWFKKLQDEICLALEQEDGKAKFKEDNWEREGGGGGRTRVITYGNLLAKGGVNFSAVYGETPDNILSALKINKADFFATGISIVIHPVNPWVPIIHMNLRYFEMTDGTNWFGGGIDLTPHYIIKEDSHYFHQKVKEACDKHNLEYYPKFKTWADDYFYIKHRKETRGIGGIFFDRLTGDQTQLKSIFEFVKEIGCLFVPLYIEIVRRNKNKPFGERELSWQTLRRGRYVEFNLVYDKGTKFGLDTNGRIESILMSLPPVATWEYDNKPELNSPESNTLNLLKKGIEWA